MENMKKTKWVIVLTALMFVGFGLSSCKKEGSEKAPEKPAATKATEGAKPGDKASCPADATAKTESKAAPAAKPAEGQPAAAAPAAPAAPAAAPAGNQPAAPTGEQAPTAKPADAGGLVPIPLVLPKAMFVGTPQNITGVKNLEPARNQPRAPFLAPAGVTNVALHKDVTSSDANPIIGELAYVTDGDKEATEQSSVELGPMLQWVQIDLGAPQTIYAMVVWHFHRQARVYFDVVVQVSDDPDFISGVKTVFNNDNDNTAGLGVGSDMNYVETNEGKLIDAKGVQGRYVRLYSKGNNSDDMNNYIEVEVFGKPAK